MCEAVVGPTEVPLVPSTLPGGVSRRVGDPRRDPRAARGQGAARARAVDLMQRLAQLVDHDHDHGGGGDGGGGRGDEVQLRRLQVPGSSTPPLVLKHQWQ